MTIHEKTLCASALRLAAIDLRSAQPETADEMESLAEKLSPLRHEENLLIKNGFDCAKALAELSGRDLEYCCARIAILSAFKAASLTNALYHGQYDLAQKIAFDSEDEAANCAR